MNITTARRIAQVFFWVWFVWFCVVSSIGEKLWQLRGWPVNWFLQLDPLVALGVLLATHTIYWGLLWGLAIIVLTLFLGRFFCGWVCPMGSLQQFVGYLGQRGLSMATKIRRSRYHDAQQIKYWLLLFLLAAASADFIHFLFSGPFHSPALFALVFCLLAAMLWIARERSKVKSIAVFAGIVVVGAVLYRWSPQTHWLSATLQVGLLDPLVFIQRAVNLVLLPIADSPLQITSAIPRFYQGAGVMGMLFILVLALCVRIPRFYCRFICPLGAFFGLLSRWALFRIGKSEDRCKACQQCEAHCEGACAPSQVIRTPECVLCLNCMDRCGHGLMAYATRPSAAGEQTTPDLNRRHVITAIAMGLAAAPMMRLNGSLASHWNPALIRPPGALNEAAFLSRCIKCGQCMRICPTNVIHPATWQAGVEGFWTPVLNYRIGTSGCQHNCVACSHICPTAALRPLSVDERMGRNQYAARGALRTGMAFVDHGRCLPWAMDTPCIVCQENCPVSPKAIYTRVEYRTLRNGSHLLESLSGNRMVLDGGGWKVDTLAGGDYFLQWADRAPIAIAGNAERTFTLAVMPQTAFLPKPGDAIQVAVRLQKPYVDPHRCIGCGICEHECPVQGQRAIRVSAENESRHAGHRLIIEK